MKLVKEDFDFVSNLLMQNFDWEDKQDLIEEMPLEVQKYLRNNKPMIIKNLPMYKLEYIFEEKEFINLLGKKENGYPIKDHPQLFFSVENNIIEYNCTTIKKDTTCEHNYTFDEFSSNNSKYIHSPTIGHIFITISNEDPNIGLIQEPNGNNRIYNIKEDKVVSYLN